MRSRAALLEFHRFLWERGQRVEQLRASSAISAMSEFYLARRAEDVDVEADGDLLLFQWGTHDWGAGPSFQYNITRQLTSDGGEEMWQLQLTLHFHPSEPSAALGSGNAWCGTPRDVIGFLELIADHPATAHIAETPPARVELSLDPC